MRFTSHKLLFAEKLENLLDHSQAQAGPLAQVPASDISPCKYSSFNARSSRSPRRTPVRCTWCGTINVVTSIFTIRERGEAENNCYCVINISELLVIVIGGAAINGAKRNV